MKPKVVAIAAALATVAWMAAPSQQPEAQASRAPAAAAAGSALSEDYVRAMEGLTPAEKQRFRQLASDALVTAREKVEQESLEPALEEYGRKHDILDPAYEVKDAEHLRLYVDAVASAARLLRDPRFLQYHFKDAEHSFTIERYLAALERPIEGLPPSAAEALERDALSPDELARNLKPYSYAPVLIDRHAAALARLRGIAGKS